MPLSDEAFKTALGTMQQQDGRLTRVIRELDANYEELKGVLDRLHSLAERLGALESDTPAHPDDRDDMPGPGMIGRLEHHSYHTRRAIGSAIVLLNDLEQAI